MARHEIGAGAVKPISGAIKTDSREGGVLRGWAQRHAVAIAYCVAFAIMIAITFKGYLFGPKVFVFADIGSDTRHQYFAYYVYLVNAISSGESIIWNFDYGLGSDIIGVQAWTMDPFAWINVAFGLLFGAGILKYTVLAVHILKIALAVALFNRYLKYFDISPRSRVVFSLLYGLNGFMMLWGQHYFFGTAVVYLALLLCAIEQCISCGSWKSHAVIVFAVFLVMVFSIYIGYMTILFCALYVLLRVAYVMPAFTVRSYLGAVLPMAVSFVLGISLACIVDIPSALNLLGDSGRMGASGSSANRAAATLTFREGGEWLVLSRFLSNNLVIDSQLPVDTAVLGPTNYYEFPQVSTSFIFFLLIPQFFVWTFRHVVLRRRRAIIVVSSVLVAGYFATSLLPLALYAFVEASYRSTFVLIPLLCLACAIAWDKMVMAKKVNSAALAVGLAINLVVLTASMWYSAHTGLKWPLAIGACMTVGTVLAFVCLVIAQTTRSSAVWKACTAAVAILMLLACACDGWVTNCHRTTWSDGLEIFEGDEYGRASSEAVRAIHEMDDSFYRIEKTYIDISDTSDSLYQGYAGITSYNSTLSPGMRKFYERFWPDVSTSGGVYQFYWNDPDNPEQATLLGIKYLISREPLDYEWLEELESGTDCHVYRNILVTSIGTKLYKSLTPAQYDSASLEHDHILDDYVLLEGDSDGSEPLISDEDRVDILFDNGDVYYLSQDDVVRGVCSMESDGYLVLAIPAKAGWSVTVDGQQVEVLKGDYGLCTVEVQQGAHEIVASYHIAGIEVGGLISVVGLVVGVLWLLFLARRSPKVELAGRRMG